MIITSQINCDKCINHKICKINEKIKEKYGNFETYQKHIEEVLHDDNIPLLTLSVLCPYFTATLNTNDYYPDDNNNSSTGMSSRIVLYNGNVVKNSNI